MTPPAAPRGPLSEIKQRRLRAHGVTTLVNAGKLIDKLLGLNVIPGTVARRLEVTRDDIRTAAGAKAPATAEQKPARVANELRKRIEAGEFPQGAQLIMSRLAAEYGVSPGTVCGALSDLGREDLVYLDDEDGRWHVKAAAKTR